ncbi:MAG: IPT/TIG domain-containing protein [Bacteroidota bacterium]
MTRYRIVTLLLPTTIALVFVWYGCEDLGNELDLIPVVTAVEPDSAAIGDTVRILGSSFGASQGTSVVTIGGQQAGVIVLWSDTEIRARVPAGAASGTVTVRVGNTTSNPVSFNVIAGPPPPISFASDIYPLFSLTQYGCNGCHNSGTAPYYVANNASATRANLVNVDATTGSCTDKKRVVVGNANESVLYLRVAGTTCGDRMPQGGSPISPSHLNLIRDWINQGAAP